MFVKRQFARKALFLNFLRFENKKKGALLATLLGEYGFSKIII